MQPRIIPRKEHCVSRKQISPNAVRTLYRLHSNGFIAFLVGGCVRDLLLGRSPKDFDIATDARPNQIKRLFRNCRLIGRRFRLAHLHFQNEILEVSTFRRAGEPSENGEPAGTEQTPRRPWHVKDEDGMILVDNVFGTPEEDALRRDFTINALAYNIADFSVIDYSTGLIDLQQRLIRPIGDPLVRFTEDPVRMLRAVRFAASHDFAIEAAAWERIRELSPIICRTNPARLYEEMSKIFLLGSAGPAFGILTKSGLLAALFPALTDWLQKDQRRSDLMNSYLASIDRMRQEDSRPSLSLFLAVFFGPAVEEAAIERHREGIPYQQALDQVFADFMKDVCRTVAIPNKVSIRVKAILALQASLHRMPRRRPASLVGRPEFSEALAYLRISAEAHPELRTSLEWWDAFLLRSPSQKDDEASLEDVPVKKRRKRRRKTRARKKTPSGQTGNTDVQ